MRQVEVEQQLTPVNFGEHQIVDLARRGLLGRGRQSPAEARCKNQGKDSTLHWTGLYLVAPLMNASGSTSVDAPAACITSRMTAAVWGEKRKFMPR